MTHLDTSFLIRAVRRGSPEGGILADRLREDEPLAVSAVVWAEFCCGPVAPDHRRLAEEIVTHQRDLTAGQAEIAARLYDQTGRRRGSLADCLIAAAAIADGAPLLTSDLGDFRRFSPFGLRVA